MKEEVDVEVGVEVECSRISMEEAVNVFVYAEYGMVTWAAIQSIRTIRAQRPRVEITTT